MPERRRIGVLNRVEKVAIEEIDPYDDAHLGLVHEDERDDERHRDAALQRRKGNRSTLHRTIRAA